MSANAKKALVREESLGWTLGPETTGASEATGPAVPTEKTSGADVQKTGGCPGQKETV